MTTHGSSAPERHATPHATNQTISDAIRRRAQSLTNDRTIDASDRAFIRYALATNDAAGLAELVRRADTGEPILDESCMLEANDEISTEEKPRTARRDDLPGRRSAGNQIVHLYRIPMTALLLTLPRKLTLTNTSWALRKWSGSLITTWVNQSRPGTLPTYSTFTGYIVFPASST